MKLYIFRHGKTAGNAEHRFLGITDEPLSQNGIDEAATVGHNLTVKEVVVSPLKRTQMTAAILFPNARQRICHGLREMNFGDFENRCAEDMSTDIDFRYWVEQTQCMGPCPHGEARMVFQHRACAAFRKEVERAAKMGNDSLYLVVHGGTIMSIMSRFARPEAPYYSWLLENCHGYLCDIHIGPEDMELRNVSHLDKVM